MRIPRKLVIGGQDVAVRYRKKLKIDGQDLLGLCDYEHNQLLLLMGMAKSKKTSVFVHEYWHYVALVYDLNWNEKQVIMHEVETLRLFNNLNIK